MKNKHKHLQHDCVKDEELFAGDIVRMELKFGMSEFLTKFK